MPIKPNLLPSVEKCKMALDYDPETGLFTRKLLPDEMYKTRRSKSIMAVRDVGKPAGSVAITGYVSIYLFGKLYVAHRLAWHMAIGPIPDGMVVDHINGNRSDNRLCNLRLATSAQNNMNSNRKKKKNGLPKGVIWHSSTKSYQARIKLGKKDVSLGLYKNKLLAYDAYVAAAIKHHGQFANL